MVTTQNTSLAQRDVFGFFLYYGVKNVNYSKMTWV